MTTTPDSKVRAALDGATRVEGLTFDPEAVLHEGHRVVRRRRIAATGLTAAATAVVAVVAVQLGTGQPRALPAGPSTSPTAVVTALHESGQLSTNGSSEVQVMSGPGLRLEVESTSGGKVRETWQVLQGTKTVRTVRREVPRPQVGGSSLLLPTDGGLPGVIAGWVDTGSPRTLNVSPRFVPPTASSGETTSTTGLVPSGGGSASTRRLFITQVGRVMPDQLAGLTWSEMVDAADPVKQGFRAALTANPRSDIARALLTAPDGDQWVAWSDDSHFGLLSGRGVQPGPDGSGPIQTLPVPARTGLGTTPDLLFGWANGTAGVTATSSDPADRLVVSFDPAGGRTAFLVAPQPPSLRIKGAVTVTVGGSSTTVGFAGTGQG
ncbi:hypothetical protein GCM10009740_25890 [Terrabacter terrae]|uniref:Anti-sigma factor n=1 Tax=Terrabacter terrae TaxID=318434 RepID=A0ABN2UE19_9MICO